ncbi:hypothetical protein [Pseudohongiella acticola]|jgi:hypothetical protein|uniref:hypothetical protein n=1 Tax=Pseudohongiella acticola TaxID=1524254 RepID=UPI0030ED20F5
MRRLALVLLMLNLLYALWVALQPASGPVETAGDRSGVETLVLMSEIERPLSIIERQPELCIALGPFSDESSLRALASEQLQGRDWRAGVEAEPLVPLYRVLVPPAETGPAGAALLTSVRSAIEGAGLDIDTYLVVGGDLDGVVSLGLFADRDNASNVYEQVSGLGAAVEMQVENRTRRVYFIVFQNDEDSDFIQESAEIAQGIDAGAGITEKLCEMIALPD